ncbi:redoxin domain-containing protein [Draconibacterium sp. IB214405]|uniref:peroxiredoxin family protein n=1 Tax=Draconibacterium sp. IB214405 TaxID=3097352 RepID=UPI002A1370B6|nr:redoxin domain-containing protein [Draconibacterium sp. IB214405]MDX8340086.1 redoxin domain-containing protein [Draconibacterium sp. IB214405]
MIRLSFLLLICFTFQLSAQNYSINVTLEQAPNKTIQLAYHYLGKIYAADKTTLDENGQGTFTGDSLLSQGLYKILVDQDHHFDFLLGADQQFSLTNPTFDGKNSIIEGAPESEAFINYMNYLSGLQQKSSTLNQAYRNADEQEKEKIANQREALDTEMQAYWATVNKKFPDSFLYKFITANYVPELDESTLPPNIVENDSLLLRAKFNYQREHYWDYFDYTDERYLYTPFYKTKVETWFEKVLYPAYDSVKPYVYQFLEDVYPNKRIFQFATSFFLNSSLNSNFMGMDALFVDLARDYYLSGEAFWATDETLEQIRENVLFLQDNLIGATAPDLTLESFDGEFINLHQIESKLTVLLIYEPNCSHCKVFIPEFYNDVYLPNKDKGLEVYAIYSMDDKEEWAEFLTKHNMFDWLNVWDPDHSSRFKIKYDGRKTPGVFLLDETKKILGKKMTIEQLQEIIAIELN